MKKTISIMLFPVLLFAVLVQFNAIPVQHDNAAELNIVETPVFFASENIGDNATSVVIKSPGKASEESDIERTGVSFLKHDGSKRDSIVSYALTLLGSPYLFAGNTKDGFDCSGFTTHVFDQNGVAIKRSSGLQSTEGIPVDRSEAAPGDLVIFTGTDKSVREPGHVGIVISEPGDTIEFVHASSSRSDGGVKISQVEGSGYDARFLEVRRVL